MINRSKVYIIILLAASVIVHFAYFGHPAETVFDEVHFGKFISGYFTGEYFFDIHPPLGKLIISGAGYLAGFKSGFSFENIGQGFPDNTYLWLRLLPMLAGILLPLVIFFLIRRLGLSDFAAFTGGLLVVFENALLVQSRFILLDSFLLLFGFLSLLFYLKHRGQEQNFSISKFPNFGFLFLSGLFASLAFSVKWTGATFLALILILELKQAIKFFMARKRISSEKPDIPSTHDRSRMEYLVWKPIALIIAPLAVYFAIFVLHFSLLPKSGPGDAFMTQQFRKTLEGYNEPELKTVKPLNIFRKFIELNLQMYKSNATLTATHPYSSQWYSWPLMIRPIYYWNHSFETTNYSPPTTNSRIYLLGNPVVWWASTVAIMYLVFSVLYLVFRNVRYKIPDTAYFLTGAFILNLLPFIGIKRAMFLYHYFPALVFSIIALVYLIDKSAKRKTAFAVMIAASFAAFIFFAPLTYGLPLTEKAYHLKTWLNSWI